MNIFVTVILGIALFILPGYALLIIFQRQLDFDFGEMLCAAPALSIAVIPLILYISTYLGISLTANSVVFLLMIFTGFCLWDWWKQFSQYRQKRMSGIDPTYIYLGLIFFLALLSRIWMVQDINYPLWTDSYHHTMIAQLIVDQGIVPNSYEPYVPVNSFTYHFGFHAMTAWFHLLSNYSAPRSVVLVGQIINALVVPTTYLFTWRLFHSRKAGLIAALIVGLFSHMPALFVNWGRYTQLSAQILLPVLMVLTIKALDPRVKRVSIWLLVGILAAGLFLVHIRIYIFYVMFAGLLFLGKLIRGWNKPDQAKHLLMGSITIGITMLVIDAPWIWRLYSGFGTKVIEEVADGYQAQKHASYLAFHLQDMFNNGMHPGWYLMAVLGGIWGIIKKEPYVWLLLAWVMSLFVAANLHIIGITPLFSNTIVIICLYLPIATLVGYFISQLIAQLRPQLTYYSLQTSPRLQLVAIIMLIVIGSAGVKYITGLIAPQNSFVQSADLKAMQWIERNVPQENSIFYIDMDFWTPELVHGLDGGYWIPLLTQRQTTVPAEIYGSDGTTTYIKFINERARALSLANHTPEQFWQAIMEYNITHVYIGSRKTNLRPEFFLTYPTHFETLYSQDGVWIFKVTR